MPLDAAYSLVIESSSGHKEKLIKATVKTTKTLCIDTNKISVFWPMINYCDDEKPNTVDLLKNA